MVWRFSLVFLGLNFLTTGQLLLNSPPLVPILFLKMMHNGVLFKKWSN